MEAIIVATITGVLSLIGVVVSNKAAFKKTCDSISEDIRVSQAVTNTKIETLTQEVKDQSFFAQKIPVIEEQIKVINHRIDDLEHPDK